LESKLKDSSLKELKNYVKEKSRLTGINYDFLEIKDCIKYNNLTINKAQNNQE
jgi:hypothetical protein